ncbi:efflux system membrane protein [compost metagenome]
MNGHFDIYGVYVPTLLLLLLGAYVVKSLLHTVLVRIGFYRFVWHPPLFNLALYLMVLGALFTLVPGL